MEPRGMFRGAIAAILIGLGLVTMLWTLSPGVAAEEATILVVDGQVTGGKAVAFDLARLKSLPAIQVTTMTPWTDGESTFEGVRMRDLLERLGAEGKAVIADAVDDYRIAIPMNDIEDYDVIIAYAMNGRPLPDDDKGPLWIIYPYSEHAGLQKDIYFSRSVWQLNRLTVE